MGINGAFMALGAIVLLFAASNTRLMIRHALPKEVS
jgi:hypothetical protein